jgi:hypothetical protein
MSKAADSRSATVSAAAALAPFKGSLGAVSHALLACSLLSACAGGSRSIPDPTAKHLEYAEKSGYPSTLPSLKNGRRLYVNRCSDCHTLHAPTAYTAAQWPTIVLDMASNAEINEDQIRDITRYLVAVSAASAPAAPPPPANPVGTPDSVGVPMPALD